MNTIKITDFNQLTTYSEKLPTDLEWFEENTFEFADNIPGIKLHIKGERFDSTMSTTLMRSILKLQEGVYRQYSIYKYGEIRRLSPEERAMLELYVKVDEGSSWLEIDLKPIIETIAEKIKKMNTKQFLAGVAIVSIAATICVVSDKAFDHKRKIKELEIQSEALTEIQRATAQAQIESIKATTEFYKEIAKQTGTSEIEINNEKIDAAAIKQITTSPREKKENSQELVSNSFKVTDIHIHDRYEDSAKDISLDIISKDGIVYKDVSILEGLIDKDDYQMLKDSTNKKFMNMKIVITKHGNEIIGAFLNSVEEE